MTMRAAALLALACTPLVTTVARAQGDRWERTVRAQLGSATESLGARAGPESVATWFGMLNVAESDSVILTLQAATSYVVLAACDEDCSRLSLLVSDLRSHDLAVDRASDHAPAVRLTPPATASYRVKVVMEACQMNPCRYGIAVLTPPAP